MLKIDLGAGQIREPGWLSVDMWAGNKPDIVADIRQMIPLLANGCATAVRCWHVMEHLEGEDWKRVVAEMERLLQEGGTFEIRVPHPSYDDAMIHGHLHVLTPFYWRCAKDAGWLGPRMQIVEIVEVPNEACQQHCEAHNVDFNIWSPFMRNAYRETIVRGVKKPLA